MFLFVDIRSHSTMDKSWGKKSSCLQCSKLEDLSHVWVFINKFLFSGKLKKRVEVKTCMSDTGLLV